MSLLFHIADYLGDTPNMRASRTASVDGGDDLRGRGLATSWSPFASVCKQWYRIYKYHKFTRPELAARGVESATRASRWTRPGAWGAARARRAGCAA